MRHVFVKYKLCSLYHLNHHFTTRKNILSVWYCKLVTRYKAKYLLIKNKTKERYDEYFFRYKNSFELSSGGYYYLNPRKQISRNNKYNTYPTRCIASSKLYLPFWRTGPCCGSNVSGNHCCIWTPNTLFDFMELIWSIHAITWLYDVSVCNHHCHMINYGICIHMSLLKRKSPTKHLRIFRNHVIILF